MKKFVMVFGIWFLSISSVFAQNWFAGGSVALNFNADKISTAEGIKTTMDSRQINISPIVGYKINKFDFGINPIFQYEVNERDDNYDRKDSMFGIGVGLFLRYNFFTFKKFSILGHLSTDYLYSKWDSKSQNSTNDMFNHKISINLKPVFEYRFLDRLSVYTDFGINGLTCSYVYSSYSEALINTNRFVFTLPSHFNIKITEFSIGFYINF
jgi:long-subunit fatty acid transport protein